MTATVDFGTLIAQAVAGSTALTDKPVLRAMTSATTMRGAEGVAWSPDGRWLYVASYEAASLTVIDCANPDVPIIAGTLTDVTNLTTASSVAVIDVTHVAVGTVGNHWTVVDVTNPAAPVYAGGLNSATVSWARHLAVRGSTVFSVNRNAGTLNAINCAVPAAPVLTSTLTDAALAAANYVTIVGATAYVCGTGPTGKLVIVDVTNPATMTVLGSSTLANVTAVVVVGATAYVVSSDGVLYVVDVTNPAAPVTLGSVTDASRLGAAGDIIHVGSYCLVVTTGGRLTRVDVSVAAAPVVTESVASATEIIGGVTGGGHKKMAVSAGGLLAITRADYCGISLLSKTPSAPKANDGTVVIFGDSITEFNGGGTNARSNRGYMTWANALLGQPFVIRNNGGSSGNQTFDLLARIWSSCLVYRPAWVDLLIGTNDCGALRPLAAIRADLTSLVSQIVASGSRLRLYTLTPKAPTGVAAATVLLLGQVNSFIRHLASVTPGVVLVETYPSCVDPVTGGTFQPSEFLDGLHPGSEGARIMGSVIAAAVRSIGFSPGGPLSGSSADTANMLVNAAMNGSSGGVATSWSLSGGGSYTPSKVTRTDSIRGEWQQIVLASGTVTLSPTTAPLVPAAGNPGAVGDVIEAAVEIQVDPGAAFTALNLSLVTGSLTLRDSWPDDATSTFHPSGSMVFRTFRGIVPAGATSFVLALTATGAGTIRVGRALLHSTLPS